MTGGKGMSASVFPSLQITPSSFVARSSNSVPDGLALGCFFFRSPEQQDLHAAAHLDGDLKARKQKFKGRLRG